jgi:murein tripeptide amidase MpaA
MLLCIKIKIDSGFIFDAKIMVCIILIFLALYIKAAPVKVSYEDHQIIRFTITNDEQSNTLYSLIDNMAGVELLKNSQDTFDIQIAPYHMKNILNETEGFQRKTLINNLQKLIDEQEADRKNLLSRRNNDIFDDYQTTDAYMDYLLGQSGAVEFSIGQTYLGASIRGVKFGSGPKTIVFSGGIHAREWISPATTTYVAGFLMGNDPRAVSLRQKFTFHVIPVLNPEGYAYSQTTDRMWRKNRQPNENSTCIGTDINRNFKFKWGTVGAVTDPCREEYLGSSAHSTAEAFGLDSYVRSLPNVVSYFDIHSYTQKFLYSWGYSCTEVSPDANELFNSTKAASEAIEKVHGTKFEYGESCSLYSLTSGTTDDHFYAENGIKYSMTIELRDIKDFGFLLPPSQIKPSGEEMVEGLVAFWSYVALH